MQQRINWTTYRFFIYGFLGGTLFLFLGIWIEASRQHLPLTYWSFLYLHRTVPMTFMLDLAPLVFATMLGLIGLQRNLYSTIEKAKREWEVTFDASLDPIFVIDEHSRILRCNRAVTDRLNTTFPNVIGKLLSEVLDVGQSIDSQLSANHENDLDSDSLSSIISGHESGLNFIAAPTFPSEADTLRPETLGAALHLVKRQYQYIVADLPHDFSEVALQALDAADIILMVASPDMASVRAVNAALDTYDKLGYAKEKIRLVLSAIFPHSVLTKEKIETALRMPAIATIPYVQNLFVDSINLGQPLVLGRPKEPVSGLLEDFAFHLSKDSQKKSRPENPTETWMRVYQRYQQKRSKR